MAQHSQFGASATAQGFGLPLPCQPDTQRPSPPRLRRPHQLAPTRLVISPRARAFRKRFFPTASAHEWNDWRWQLRQRIKDLDTLARIMRLSDDERTAIAHHQGPLPVGINPYYASLLDPDDVHQPLRATMVPVNGEYVHAPGEAVDPLGEESHSPVPGLVHRYPDPGAAESVVI